jgi:hypothetical protein
MPRKGTAEAVLNSFDARRWDRLARMDGPMGRAVYENRAAAVRFLDDTQPGVMRELRRRMRGLKAEKMENLAGARSAIGQLYRFMGQVGELGQWNNVPAGTKDGIAQFRMIIKRTIPNLIGEG